MSPITTTLSDVQERISIAYVTAVAARAGCQLSEPRVDRNGIDVTVSAIQGTPVKIDLQLKASYALARSDGAIKYDLDIPTYNKLRSTFIQSAQLLVVLDLPRDKSLWVQATADALIVQKCAFWRNLAGEPESPNATTIRVSLPSANIFGPRTLVELMTRADAKARAGLTGI